MPETPEIQTNPDKPAEIVFDKAGNYNLNGNTYENRFIITANGITINNFTLKSDIIINAKSATIKNATVSGNITVDKEIGSGADSNAYLNTVKTDKLIVKGGGMNSIYFVDSGITEMVVDKEDDSVPVRVVIEGETAIIRTTVQSAVMLQNDTATIRDSVQLSLLIRYRRTQPLYLPETSKILLLKHPILM